MIPFNNTCAEGLEPISSIVVMGKVDTFDRLVIPIGVSFIEIGTNVGTQLRLEFQLLLCLQDFRS